LQSYKREAKNMHFFCGTYLTNPILIVNGCYIGIFSLLVMSTYILATVLFEFDKSRVQFELDHSKKQEIMDFLI
jgi:hypothetical protein